MNNFYHQLVSLTTIESTINYFKTRVSVGDLSSRVREHRLKRCTIVRSNECTSEHSLEAVQLSNLRVFHPHTIPPMKYGGAQLERKETFALASSIFFGRTIG